MFGAFQFGEAVAGASEAFDLFVIETPVSSGGGGGIYRRFFADRDKRRTVPKYVYGSVLIECDSDLVGELNVTVGVSAAVKNYTCLEAHLAAIYTATDTQGSMSTIGCVASGERVRLLHAELFAFDKGALDGDAFRIENPPLDVVLLFR